MIFSTIRRSILAIFVLFNIANVSAQNVHFYKLTRKIIDGESCTNVSGGQFITIIGAICFESDKYGISVNHGNMKRNNAYSNSQYSIYQGSSYWGENTTFKFNSDKSVLNVVLDNGDVYIYKRATAPTRQETCSLIRKSGGGGSVVVTPPVNPGGQVVMPPINPTSPTNPGGTTPTPTHGRTAHQVTKSCPLCQGSGKCNSCNGTHHIRAIGSTTMLECPNCRPNGACSKCGGIGKITTTEWY